MMNSQGYITAHFVVVDLHVATRSNTNAQLSPFTGIAKIIYNGVITDFTNTCKYGVISVTQRSIMADIIEDRRIKPQLSLDIIRFSAVDERVVHDVHIPNILVTTGTNIATDFNSVVVCCVDVCTIIDNEVFNRHWVCKDMNILYPDATNDFCSGFSS